MSQGYVDKARNLCGKVWRACRNTAGVGWSLFADRFPRDLFALALILALAFPLYFLHPLTHRMPLDCAGLYSLMAEGIRENGFRLPLEIAYYGPGGIPFAYPPLGPFIMALLTGIMSPLAYLRFAPAAFGMLTLIPYYFLARKLTGTPMAAVTATILLMTLPGLYILHIAAGGVVRGLAYLFVITALLFFVLGMRKARKGLQWKTIISGVLFGLTILTHFSYAVFYVISVAVLAVVESMKHKDRIRRLLLVLVPVFIGFLVSLPWIISMIGRYGTQPFLLASETHGTLQFVDRLSEPKVMFEHLMGLRSVLFDVPFLGVLIIVGTLYCLTAWRVLLPAWLLVIILSMGEYSRFLMTIGCMIVSMFIVALLRLSSMEGQRRWVSRLRLDVILLVVVPLAYVYIDNGVQIASLTPSVSDETVALASWVQTRTSVDETYLFVDDTAESEWLPWFLKREPAVAPWGGEWIGTFRQQGQLWQEIGGCLLAGELECVEGIVNANNLATDYIITLADFPPLPPSRYTLVYQNDRYRVWQVAEPTGNSDCNVEAAAGLPDRCLTTS